MLLVGERRRSKRQPGAIRLSERSERSNQIVQLLDQTRHNPNDSVVSVCALLGTPSTRKEV